MPQSGQFSNRQKEVVRLLVQGKSNKQIALALGISERTVEFHLKNVYAKFNVSSRIELVLKLGNTTGGAIAKLLGESTVAHAGETAENGDRSHSGMDWAASFREAVSVIGREPQMKKRWIIYFVSGVLFGAAYWHYFGITARFFNDLDATGGTIGEGLLFLLALLTYFGVWLIPATIPAVYESRRSMSVGLSVLAAVTVWVSAVLGYYLNYLAMLALIGLPNMEHLLILGGQTNSLW
jgi:DNA-binding CsgD family transcriptional regulator